jgi:hypothetical protein
MEKPIGHSVLKQLAIVLCLVGVALLVHHLATQIGKGSASWDSLIGGAASFGIGLLFTVLGDLGIRLHRLERESGGGSKQSPPEGGDGPRITDDGGPVSQQ